MIDNLSFDNLDEVLDVGDWKQTKSYNSIHGPLCPTCEKQFPKGACGPHGLATCPHCNTKCHWQLTPSILGHAWTTWAKTTSKL